MRHQGNRKIKIKKSKLIATLKENKKNHIKEYEKALALYKEEAIKQLTKLTADAQEGKTNLHLNLVEPVNNAENYDKVIEMFEWEVEKTVELEQNEFREYVQDETDFAMQAKFANMSYTKY